MLLLSLATGALMLLAYAFVLRISDSAKLAVSAAFAVALLAGVLLIPLLMSQRKSLLRALSGAVHAYKDHDFSFAIRWDASDEFYELVQAHRALGDALRAQNLHLVQRELLLDAMNQSSPVASILALQQGPIVIANRAARELLAQGENIVGLPMSRFADALGGHLMPALAQPYEGVLSVASEDDDEAIYYLSKQSLHVHGQAHDLILLRTLTRDLQRQEVRTWKKVLRVISHEINNSLAPIRSLAHSAQALLQQDQVEKAMQSLAYIQDRVTHLDQFLSGYATFAKLPIPQCELQPWRPLLQAVRAQFAFALREPSQQMGFFDRTQIEQALLNALKNAHESGSAPDAIELAIRAEDDYSRIDVLDRGPGMRAAVMTQALVPFYSTKRSGSGIGLALIREIVEAHGGRIALANRAQGGLQLTLWIPSAPTALSVEQAL
jgi:two-component system, NtrC family, nitrogen regulation sensor histidine kinase NtrY